MPDGMSDRTPEDMPDRMSDIMPEDMPNRMPEGMPDRMPDKMSDRMPEDMPDKVPQCLPDRMPEDLPDNMPEDMTDRMPDRMPEDMPEDMPGRMPEDMPGRMPEDMPDRMPEGMPDRMPDKMPDRMAEDLPVTKFINVMVGITRSKVIYIYNMFLLYFSDLVQNLSLQADLLFFELCGQMSDISQQSHEYRKLCLWSESHCEDLLSIEDGLSSFLRWSDCTSILSAWRCPMKRYGTELLAPSCTNFAPYNSAS